VKLTLVGIRLPNLVPGPYFGFILQLREKLTERFADEGVKAVGENLAQRRKNEPPQMQARMWDCELKVLFVKAHDQVIVEQKIKINRAGTFFNHPLASQAVLYLKAAFKQSERIKLGSQGDHLIEEVGLVSVINRLGLID